MRQCQKDWYSYINSFWPVISNVGSLQQQTFWLCNICSKLSFIHWNVSEMKDLLQVFMDDMKAWGIFVVCLFWGQNGTLAISDSQTQFHINVSFQGPTNFFWDKFPIFLGFCTAIATTGMPTALRLRQTCFPKTLPRHSGYHLNFFGGLRFFHVYFLVEAWSLPRAKQYEIWTVQRVPGRQLIVFPHKWEKAAESARRIQIWPTVLPKKVSKEGGEDGRGADPEVRPLRTMDVFAGVGGLAIGLEQAGVADAKWAIEYVKDAANAFKVRRLLNHTWTEIKLNLTWVYLGSKGAMRTPSIRVPKRAPTSYVSALTLTYL